MKSINIISISLVLMITISSINASTTQTKGKQFNAYRMLQFDSANNVDQIVRLGPNRSILNAPSMKYQAQLPIESYKQSTVVIDDTDFNLQLLKQLVSSEGDVAGIVVLLSKGDNHRDSYSLGDLQQLAAIEINVPLYFVKGDEFDQSYLDGDYRLIVGGPAPAPVVNPSSTVINNLAGILRGQTPAESYVSPTVLVVAHYDSFGVIPALRGATGNEPATGVVALLELSRLFSRLYANAKNQANHNIMFLLSGGSSLNFEGTRKWLESQPLIVTDAIDFVLCLDSIGEPTEDLFLHVSRPPKENATRQLYAEFTGAAAAFDAKLEVTQKKINISNPAIFWEHEVFSRKKIPAVTISQKQSPLTNQRAIIYDSKPDITTLKRNIKIVAQALISHIYHNDRISSEIMSGSLDINEPFLESWLESLSSTVRMYPYSDLSSTPAASSSSSSNTKTKNNQNQQQQQQQEISLIQGLEKVMKTYLNEVQKESVKVDPLATNTYYQPSQVLMSFYHVKPFTFDLLMIVATIAYLLVIYLLFKGKEAIKEINHFFSPLLGKSKSK